MKQKRKLTTAGPGSAKLPEPSTPKTRKTHPALAAAIARGKIVKLKIVAAEGGSITCKEVAGLLGISEKSVIRRWRNYRLVGWTNGKTVRFPVWQFSNGKLLPGIQEALQIFRSDDHWRVLIYFLGNRRSLAMKRPLDLLRCGEINKVIRHATDYAQANEW
jgi:hypothetical protein